MRLSFNKIMTHLCISVTILSLLTVLFTFCVFIIDQILCTVACSLRVDAI